MWSQPLQSAYNGEVLQAARSLTIDTCKDWPYFRQQSIPHTTANIAPTAQSSIDTPAAIPLHTGRRTETSALRSRTAQTRDFQGELALSPITLASSCRVQRSRVKALFALTIPASSNAEILYTEPGAFGSEPIAYKHGRARPTLHRGKANFCNPCFLLSCGDRHFLQVPLLHINLAPILYRVGFLVVSGPSPASASAATVLCARRASISDLSLRFSASCS